MRSRNPGDLVTVATKFSSGFAAAASTPPVPQSPVLCIPLLGEGPHQGGGVGWGTSKSTGRCRWVLPVPQTAHSVILCLRSLYRLCPHCQTSFQAAGPLPHCQQGGPSSPAGQPSRLPLRPASRRLLQSSLSPPPHLNPSRSPVPLSADSKLPTTCPRLSVICPVSSPQTPFPYSLSHPVPTPLIFQSYYNTCISPLYYILFHFALSTRKIYLALPSSIPTTLA